MTTTIPLRLGTRRSPMAMSQSGAVARLITARTGREIELIGITSHGDVSQAQLTQIGGTGVFVSNLREALLHGEADFAVHSLKDLPTGAAPGITLAAIPDRDDPRDALVGRDGLKLADLPRGARVGTGSPRRAQQLGLLRSDITCVSIRGNANTRLAKVGSGELDAVVLAYAGLARIGHTDLISEIFEPDSMLPAPGQGALAIECRTDDPDMVRLLSSVDDAATRAAVTAERTLLATLEAGCSAPVGAYACGSIRMKLQAVVVGVDETAGSETMVVREHAEGEAADAAGLGRDLAARMLARGAARLMGAADSKSDGAPRGRTTDRDDAHD
jgi:hydroxymethylbilane synthase